MGTALVDQFVPLFDGHIPSLGYGIVQWIETYLRHPDVAGNPTISLTPAQTAFIVDAYAIHPRTGRRVVKRATHQTAKGTGKAFESAGLAFCTLCGPTMFDYWDGNGQPVGRCIPNAQIYVAAPSEEATANIYNQVYGIGEVSKELVDGFGLDIGYTRTNRKGGGFIKPVAVSLGAREGAPTDLVLIDESQHWTLPRHHQVSSTMFRNATKRNGLTVMTTNAFRIGGGSVAETEHDAAQESGGILYVSEEPENVDYDPKDPENTERLRSDLEVAYGGALAVNGGWLDLERIVEDIQEDPKLSANEAKRFFLNVPTVGEHGLADMALWPSLERPGVELAEGSSICLGFDGSRSGDSTALVAITEDLTLFLLGVWERPEGLPDDAEWSVDRQEVRMAIDEAFGLYDVRRMFADPYLFTEMLDALAVRYGSDRVVQFFTATQSKRYSAAIDLFRESVASESMHHHGSAVLSKHVAAAQAQMQGTKYKKLVKRRHSDKIDGAVAAVLARSALQSWVLDAATRKPRRRGRVLGSVT